MTSIAVPGPAAPTIPRWGFLLLATVTVLLWAVTMEAGPLSEAIGQASSFLHESFHDGRHLVGVPCH